MSKRFLGQGWRFPIVPDALGRLDYVGQEENVEQSLRILLLTAHGERVMRFGFGCKAPEVIFAPGSRRYLKLLETSIEEAVRDWEPRVEVQSVLAEADPEEPHRVMVSISYLVRQTNTRNNLVFPYYLDMIETR